MASRRHNWRITKISKTLTDQALLRELGARIGSLRLERNLTQAALAAEAGVSKRTLNRLEAGEVGMQLSGFIRVCRVLGLLERFEMLIPERLPSPVAQLELGGKTRKRASKKRVSALEAKSKGSRRTAWTWGDDT